jgi:hypothetical protein
MAGIKKILDNPLNRLNPFTKSWYAD